jgi:ketosteroid isomerase-like protein
MSTNLDLVRSIYAAWERGDWTSAEWAHPDIEFVLPDGPVTGTWRGLAAMAAAWRDFLSAWDEYRLEAEEYTELNDGCVLVLVQLFGRGKTSGLELGQTRAKGANVFHLRGGRVTRLVWATTTATVPSPTSASCQRRTARDRISQRRPRALDLRGH